MKLARDDWPRLLSLLDQALELPAPQRAGWLRRQDLSDALKAQLQALLADRRAIETGEFLKALPAVAEPDVAMQGRLTAGSRVGPYRLLRELGQGGMSTVWLAERADEQLRRQVALKLPHAGPGQELLARRMLRERDILAGLEHPNIARLYDVGVSDSGLPFLVMEFVEGVDLLAYADAKRLTIPQRLKLFQQVLRAVQYAHGKLLLHRDLKPGNILVNAAGEVKLLDFGIAKVLAADDAGRDATELTRAAGQPLTLMYASPEQVLGLPLTTACDVYALGVVLYELVCGLRPYALATPSAAQLEEAVLRQEPLVPSRRRLAAAAAQARALTTAALQRALAGDLDAMVLKPLAKRPELRYASAEALSADLGCWLAGRPVAARTPSRCYLLGKFLKRHRAAVLLGTAGSVLVCAAGTTAVLQGVAAQREATKAVAAREFMVNVFADTEPAASQGRELSGKALLEKGRDRLLNESGRSALPVDELLLSIARAQVGVQDRSGADETLARLLARLGDPEKHAARVMALLERCENALGMQHQEDAQRWLAAAAAEARDREVSPVALRMQARLSGSVAMHEDRPLVAREAFERYLSLAEAANDEDPQNLLSARVALAKVESLAGHRDAAMAHLVLATKLAAQHGAELHGAEFDELANYRSNIEVEWGNYRQEWLAPTIQACGKSLGPDTVACLTLTNQRLRILLKLGRAQEAAALAPRLWRWVTDDNDPGRQLEAAVVVARALAAAGERTQLPTLTARLEQAASDPGRRLSARYRLLALNTLAEVALLNGEPERAWAWGEKAADSVEAPEAASLTRERLKTALFQGVARQAQGQHAAALQAFGALCTRVRPAGERLAVLDALFSLNCVPSLAAEGRAAQAAALLQNALPLLRQGLGADSPTVIRAQRLQDALITPDGAVLPDPGLGGRQPAQLFSQGRVPLFCTHQPTHESDMPHAHLLASQTGNRDRRGAGPPALARRRALRAQRTLGDGAHAA